MQSYFWEVANGVSHISLADDVISVHRFMLATVFMKPFEENQNDGGAIKDPYINNLALLQLLLKKTLGLAKERRSLLQHNEIINTFSYMFQQRAFQVFVSNGWKIFIMRDLDKFSFATGNTFFSSVQTSTYGMQSSQSWKLSGQLYFTACRVLCG